MPNQTKIMPTKHKGFRLGRRLVKLFNRRKSVSYQRLHSHQSVGVGPISKLKKWVRWLRSGKKKSGYLRVGEEPVVKSPKGHLAVYVGEKEEDTCRVMVPIIYFNHPLFGELLKEAEKVYGFDHPGGIQIPCPRSEFENIQMKIDDAVSGGGGGGARKWARWS